MVNITKERQMERLKKIKHIEIVIQKKKDKQQQINKKDILMAAISNLGVSRRTAMEYLDVALYNQKIKLK